MANVIQDSIGFPLISTVQAPHSPSLHIILVPVNPSSSLSTSANVAVTRGLNSYLTPLTFNTINPSDIMIMPPIVPAEAPARLLFLSGPQLTSFDSRQSYEHRLWVWTRRMRLDWIHQEVYHPVSCPSELLQPF